MRYERKCPSVDELIAVADQPKQALAKKYGVQPHTINTWYTRARKELLAQGRDTSCLNRGGRKGRPSNRPSIDELVRLRNLSGKEMAKRYGVSINTVHCWYTQARHKRRIEGKGTSDLDVRAIQQKRYPSIERLQELVTVPVSVIADEYGVTISTVHNWYQKARAQLNAEGKDPRVLARTYGAPSHKPSVEQLIEMRNRPIRDIAAEYGVHVSAVYQWYYRARQTLEEEGHDTSLLERPRSNGGRPRKTSEERRKEHTMRLDEYCKANSRPNLTFTVRPNAYNFSRFYLSVNGQVYNGTSIDEETVIRLVDAIRCGYDLHE